MLILFPTNKKTESLTGVTEVLENSEKTPKEKMRLVNGTTQECTRVYPFAAALIVVEEESSQLFREIKKAGFCETPDVLNLQYSA